jgi:hypothetical protein
LAANGRIGRERSRLTTTSRQHLASANLLTIDDFAEFVNSGWPWLAAEVRGQSLFDDINPSIHLC